ncbi:hypothetical protein [Clostridium sp. 3-3]|uniref:hypothetical protein n=1 Tax=Clostridium sp. 3-3 TaxID=2070757 RepID=UPI001FA93C5F|nr:hypothetical protein [Clostridium sp. 3-3]
MSFDNNDNPDVNENINSLKNIISNNSELLNDMNEDSSKKLLLISKDLKFITHKVLQSEKDLFNLQEEIKNTYK